MVKFLQKYDNLIFYLQISPQRFSPMHKLENCHHSLWNAQVRPWARAGFTINHKQPIKPVDQTLSLITFHLLGFEQEIFCGAEKAKHC